MLHGWHASRCQSAVVLLSCFATSLFDGVLAKGGGGPHLQGKPCSCRQLPVFLLTSTIPVAAYVQDCLLALQHLICVALLVPHLYLLVLSLLCVAGAAQASSCEEP